MSLLNDVDLPAAIQDELKQTIATIPPGALVQLGAEDRVFAQGFRPISANAEAFRKRLLSLLNASAPLPPAPLETIRMHSLYQDFTCVLSSNALQHGFIPLAHFIGGARLLVAMLLDPREAVLQYARDFLCSKAPIPDAAPTPQAARTAMDTLFSPFLETMESILHPAPPPATSATIQPACLPTDSALAREKRNHRNRVASLEEKIAKLTTRNQTTISQLTTLRREATQATSSLQKAEIEIATQKLREKQLEVQRQETNDTLEEIKNDAASLRASLSQFQMQNRALSDQLDTLNLQISEQKLAAQTAAANHANQQRNEFVASLNTTLPAKSPPRTPRERLETCLDCCIHEREKLTFLIDGYNVILRVPKYNAKSKLGDENKHEDVLKPFRESLEHDIRIIQTSLGDCEINLYYDGPTPGATNPFCTSKIKIIYSGGRGDNRADKLIVGYMSFFANQPSGRKLITVTDDNAIREEARTQGSFILSTTDFIALASKKATA